MNYDIILYNFAIQIHKYTSIGDDFRKDLNRLIIDKKLKKHRRKK